MCDCGGIDDTLEALEQLNFNLYNQDFISTWEKEDDDLLAVLNVADSLESLHKENIATTVFKSGLAIAQIDKTVARDELSFNTAANLLGLLPQNISTPFDEFGDLYGCCPEVVAVASGNNQKLGQMYHEQLAQLLSLGQKAEIWGKKPALINLASEHEAPAKSLSDLLHIATYFEGIDGLRGRKITLCYTNNGETTNSAALPQGMATLCSRFGMEVTLAHPADLALSEQTLDIAAENAAINEVEFKVVNNLDAACNGAEIIYPMNWGNSKAKWSFGEKQLKKSQHGEALVLADNPRLDLNAKIFDKYRFDLYAQQAHRPFIIAAMMLLCRFRDPVTVLEQIHNRGQKRVGV